MIFWATVSDLSAGLSSTKSSGSISSRTNRFAQSSFGWKSSSVSKSQAIQPFLSFLIVSASPSLVPGEQPLPVGARSRLVWQSAIRPGKRTARDGSTVTGECIRRSGTEASKRLVDIARLASVL